MQERGAQSKGIVGHTDSTLMRSRDLIESIVPRLKDDPFVFLHPPDYGCAQCDEARQHVSQ